MSGQRFSAALEGIPAGGAGVRLPFDPKDEFGKARAPVHVSIGAHPPFSTTVMVYSGVAWVGLRKGQVTEAKWPATRTDRAAKTLQRLKDATKAGGNG
jgi:hypothetical protein